MIQIPELVKRCSKCHECKPLPGFHKNRSRADGIHPHCRECVEAQRQALKQANPERYAELQAKRSMKWRQANPEKAAEVSRAASRKWGRAHPEKHAALSRAWRQANPGRHAAKNREWRQANPEKHAAKNRAWRQANPERLAALNAHRRASQLRATPAWADQAAITAIYAEARRLTAETGVLHHVDHFYPLKGETVCGLHVPANLRPYPATENIRKGNRLLPESPT